MPKVASSSSTPTHDPTARMSDVAIRKKKNADAQAAFRARRANYIATLEETVTSLESVVLQLQDSCRETRNENMDLRQENSRLRHENREREKFWRALYQARKTGQVPETEDLPPPPLSSPFSGHAPVSSALSSHSSTPLVQHAYGNGGGYREDNSGAYNPGSASSGSFASQQTPTSFSHPYPYSLQGSPRDSRWPAQPTLPGSINGGEAVTPPSPAYIESPSMTSADMNGAYAGRFTGDEHKTGLHSVLDNAPYVFPNGDRYHESIPNSRSLSPSTSTPTSSTSTMPLTSFQFTFQEPPSDRADFDYRRQSLPHCPEVTLHGGTADISLTGHSASEALRYRIGRRPESSTAQHTVLPPPSENGSLHDHGSNDGDARSRRNTVHSHSRSPSPGPAPISCTVAVIKAQAFGALRRTRTKTKRTSEGAARVAMDVLEARGIPAVGSKRARHDDDDIDEDST